MTNVEIFLDYQNKWSEAFCNKDFDQYEKLAKEGLAWRNENFSKSDWEQLIAQSHGRAKYEYTRLMNERFPEKTTEK